MPDPDPELSSRPVTARRMSRKTRSRVEWAVVIAVALLVSVGIRTYWIQTFSIPSSSMVPTLAVGDRILVNKLAGDVAELNRGDIVVFERPPALDGSGAEEHLVKRLIGLPTDTVEGRDGSVYVNGKRLEEPWLPAEVQTAPFPPVTVPEGQVFMMGDNRGNSQDSRSFGPIDAGLITGRVFFRIWPPGSVGGI